MTAMDSPALMQRLGKLAPIASLPIERQEEIARIATVERYSADRGDINFKDWSGQAVYLLDGQIKLTFADGSFEVLVGGSDSAWHPLRSVTRTMVSCKPITDVELLCVDDELLDLIMAWDQSSAPSAASMPKTTDWRMMSGMFAAQNLARGAFAPLPAANITSLLDKFARIEVKRDSVIVKEKASGDHYYLIERGRAIVTRMVGGVEMEIADLKPGDAFGEEALLANAMRNATVTMKTDGVLLRLAKTDFFAMLSEPLLNRIDWHEANRRVSGGAQWIDVRFPAEFVHDGLPSAINIPLNEIRRSVHLLDASREYVTYCQSGRRSSAAAFLLSQRGHNTSVLAGGLYGNQNVRENVSK